MTAVMKAVVVHAPGEFSLEEVSRPAAPEGGLLVKVAACGLCGSDLRTLKWGHRKVRLPWIIGHEICGAIVETGKGYSGTWRAGQSLCIGPLAYCGWCEFCVRKQMEYCLNYEEIGQKWPGGFAEYISIPPECISLGNILAFPDGLDLAHGTVVEPLSSCINTHEKGGGTFEKEVVIFGAGPTGCLHTGLAKVNNAKSIYVVDRNQSRLKIASELGADEVLNPSGSDVVAAIQTLTEGKGADMVIVAAPSADAFRQALQVAKMGGKILLYAGFPAEDAIFPVDLNLIHYKALQIIGATIFAPSHYQQSLQLISSGLITVENMITRFSLWDFDKAVQLARDRKIVKAVFLL